MTEQAERRWVTVVEASALLEVSGATIRRMIADGELETRRRRPRGWHRITRRSVEAWLRNQ